MGIRAAGYCYVAWGTTHNGPDGPQTPVMAADAPPEKARELGKRCRDLGLEPLMMFSMIYPEERKGLEVLTQRLKQAQAAGIPQVLTFGHTEGGSRPVWIERFKKLGPIARDLGVLLIVKQHGGTTGTGAACAEIIREVNDPGVMVGYDAGNVLDYLHLDPIPDIRKCADVVRSFCIKDHRNWPKSAWKRLEITYDPVRASLLKSADDAYRIGFLKERPDLSRIYDLKLLNEVLRQKGLAEIQ